MGGSSSEATITQGAETKIINNSSVEVLNSSLNHHISNVTIDNSAVCGANMNTSQNASFSGNTVGGNFNYDNTQDADIVLNFFCVQQSDSVNEMATDIFTQIVNSLELSNSSEMLSELNANAFAKMEAGFGGTGGDNISNVDSVVYSDVENNTNLYLKNVVEVVVEKNFGVENIQSCIPSAYASQNNEINDNIISGDANVRIVQSASIAAFAECEQMQTTINMMSSKIATAIGVDIDLANSVLSETDQEGTSETDTERTGFFESVGELFTSIFNGVGGIITGVISGLFGPFVTSFVISCCLCCVCCIVIIIACTFGLTGGGASSPGVEVAPVPQIV